MYWCYCPSSILFAFISATDASSSGNQLSVDYAGNDDAFTISWLDGPLMGHAYVFDQEFQFKNSLQSTENQEESTVTKEIIEGTLSEDNKKVRTVFTKVKAKWNEGNR